MVSNKEPWPLLYFQVNWTLYPRPLSVGAVNHSVDWTKACNFEIKIAKQPKWRNFHFRMSGNLWTDDMRSYTLNTVYRQNVTHNTLDEIRNVLIDFFQTHIQVHLTLIHKFNTISVWLHRHWLVILVTPCLLVTNYQTQGKVINDPDITVTDNHTCATHKGVIHHTVYKYYCTLY